MFFKFCVVAIVLMGIWTGLNSLMMGRTRAYEIFKGIVTGLVQTFAVFTASSSHLWFSLVALLTTVGCVVFYVILCFHIRSFRVRKVVAVAAAFVCLFTAMWAAIEAVRFAVGPATIRAEMLLLFGRLATIVAIALVVARVLATFGRNTLVKVTIAFAAFLAVVALGFAIYGGLSNIKFKMPFSAKSVASAAKDEPEGNFILKWLGLSGEEAEVETDDESIAVVTESDDESAVAEVADESDVTNDESAVTVVAEAEKGVSSASASEGRVIKCDTYTQVVKDHPEFHIHNYDLIVDDIPYNNSYFTESIYEEGDTEDAVYKKFEEIIRECPLTFVQFYAAQAAARKTDVLGEYYANNDAEWARAINAMVQDFFDSPSDFVNHRKVLLDMLANERVGLELKHFDDIKDQFYVDSYTVSGVPRIVVCETHQSGWVLIIWLRTKGEDSRNDVGIGIDTDCGNVCAFYKHNEPSVSVSEVTEIPTEKVPEMPKGYDPPKPTPKPTAAPTPKPTAAPTPKPTATPTPKKDVSKGKGDSQEKNNDVGVGEDTNNGVGGTKSTKEQTQNTVNKSEEEINRATEQNRATNGGGSGGGGGNSGGGGGNSGSSGGSSGNSSGQRAGGESNKPSQSVSGKQDNNGNTGNGSSSIDKSTAENKTAASADTNQSVDASGSAEGWLSMDD